MSRLIQPYPSCPGVRYEGEACRMCAALVAARAEALRCTCSGVTACPYCVAIADAVRSGVEAGWAQGRDAAAEAVAACLPTCNCRESKRTGHWRTECEAWLDAIDTAEQRIRALQAPDA